MTHARITTTHASAHVHLPQDWRVMAFDALDSTNTALRRMVEMGTDAAEGLIVMAKTQTAGRGRDGRTWISPPGNLYASVLVEATGGIAHAAEISFVAALAVIETLQFLLPDRASDASIKCKWPNDVLFEGAKVAGILLETAQAPDGGKLFVVLGVGMNLVPVEVADARYPITSLTEHGGHVAAGHAMEALAKHLAIQLDLWRRHGFGQVRETWLKHAAGLGEMIVVQLPNQKIAGLFAGLDTDGALLVEEPSGTHRVLAGDLILSRAE